MVFNTGMVGYPEALTDPSYRGQILVFTYPSLGNYGVPAGDGGGPQVSPFESDRVQVSGVICARYSEEFSHHRADRSLENWLAGFEVPALTGIDTRALTQHLRTRGLDAALIDQTSALFHLCDNVRYAPGTLAVIQRTSLIDEATALIQRLEASAQL